MEGGRTSPRRREPKNRHPAATRLPRIGSNDPAVPAEAASPAPSPRVRQRDNGLSPTERRPLSVGAILSMGLIVLGVFDWSCRRWRFERELMMTREELREELARQETPENVRRKQRGFARRLLSPSARIRGGVE